MEGIRQGKYVGIFYFLWLGHNGTNEVYDNSKILAQYPEAVHDPDHPAWGPWKAYHFWGEPLYGYYRADDPWVLRKHCQLLTNAGIDFIVFDTTNAGTYKQVYDVLFEVWDDVRRQGFQVPKIVFYTNTESGKTVEKIYEDVYKTGRYSDLWFHYKGKPLIIGNPDECSDEIREFFTFRLNQWPNEEQKVNGFPWIEFQRPQRVFYNDEGEKEIISVSVAQHPSISMSDTPFYGYGDNWGRSYHNGKNSEHPEDAFKGCNVIEQWDFALAEDPSIVFITGWNEWIAMKLPNVVKERPIRFVDQCNLDFSRDIEPMKGGYEDRYYLQMIEYIEKFKGKATVVVGSSEVKTIRIDDDFSQWDSIVPEYRDYVRDTLPRNYQGVGNIVYRDETGRNDFELLKVAEDQDNLYFFAQTTNEITPYTDPSWMNLLIGIEDEEFGWNEYQYIINRSILNERETMLERSQGGWNWQPVGLIKYRVEGRKMHLSVPKDMLNLAGSQNYHIRFKWCDNNLHNPDDFMALYLHGDTAPDGRLCYIFRSNCIS